MDEHDLMEAMVEQASASAGRTAYDVLTELVPEHDEVWVAIKLRVLYIMTRNEEAIEEHGATFLPVATYLDGLLTGLRLREMDG